MNTGFYLIGAVIIQIVKADEVNIALQKPATASSVQYQNFPASTLVDGNLNTHWDSQSCFGTAHGDLQPWWMVDLEAYYRITGFKVVNRGDCCAQRVNDMTVETFLDNPVEFPEAVGTPCTFYPGNLGAGATEVIICTTIAVGRYFRMRRNVTDSPDLLSMCEVEVFGTEDNPWCSKFHGTMNTQRSSSQIMFVDTPVDCANNCTKMNSCLGFNFRWSEVPECQIVTNMTSAPVPATGWRQFDRRGC